MSNEFKIKKGLVVEGDARVTGAIFDSTNAPGTSGQVLTSTVTGTDWKSLAEISGVDGTGTANYLSKWADADTITNSIVYDNGTNVGIGTTSPSAKLEVNGALFVGNHTGTVTPTDGIWIEAPTGVETQIQMYTFGGSIFSIKGNNTKANIGWSSGQDRFVNFVNAGTGDISVGIGTTSPASKLHIKTSVDNSVSQGLVIERSVNSDRGYINYNGGGFQFRSTVGDPIVFGETDAEHMRILPDGNVGIGTTSPDAKLEVVGTTGIALAQSAGAKTVGYVTTLQSFYSINSGFLAFSGDGGAGKAIGGGAYGADTILFANNTERIRILNNGNVGIGTTSPQAKLHVSSTGESVIRIQDLDATNQFMDLGHNGGTSYFLSTNNTSNGNFTWYLYNGTSFSTPMYIASTGNVGIGTTSPENKLHVQQSDVFTGIHTTAGVRVKSDGASAINNYHGTIALSRGTGGVAISAVQEDTDSDVMGMAFFTHPSATGGDAAVEKMRLDQNGNLGIGTTSPDFRLHTNLNLSGTPLSYLNGTANTFNGTANLGVTHNSTAVGTGTAAGVYLANNANNDGAPSPIIAFSALSASGSFNHTYAAIYGIKTAGGADTNWVKGDLTFATGNTTGPERRMTILANGNVGIGTTSPAYKFQVKSDDVLGGIYLEGDNAPAFRIRDTSDNGDSLIYTNNGGRLILSADDSNVTTGSSLEFKVDGSEAMRIDSSGNVGIGTTSPGAKLDIVGTGNAVQIRRSNGYASIKAHSDNGGNLILDSDTSTGAVFLNNYVNRPVYIATGGGNVGIGTTNMYARLNVKATSHNNGISVNRAADNTAALYIGNDGGGIPIIASNNSDLIFGRDFSGTFTERMRMTNDGNFGIGTSSPGTKLQVEGTIRATGTSGNVDVDPLYGAFRFYNGSTFYGGFYNDAVLSSGNAVDLVSYVATGDYYIGSATRGKVVKVEQGGNVGIGTTSPTEKLDVNGVVNATSFSAGGTAGFTGTVNFPSNSPGSRMLDFQGGLLVSVS